MRERGKNEKANRELILKALTDPEFRRKLEKGDPAALGLKRLSETGKREVQLILDTVESINVQVSAVADEILCANTTCKEVMA